MVDHGFLFKVLVKLGINPVFVAWIRALYIDVSSCVSFRTPFLLLEGSDRVVLYPHCFMFCSVSHYHIPWLWTLPLVAFIYLVI